MLKLCPTVTRLGGEYDTEEVGSRRNDYSERIILEGASDIAGSQRLLQIL